MPNDKIELAVKTWAEKGLAGVRALAKQGALPAVALVPFEDLKGGLLGHPQEEEQGTLVQRSNQRGNCGRPYSFS